MLTQIYPTKIWCSSFFKSTVINRAMPKRWLLMHFHVVHCCRLAQNIVLSLPFYFVFNFRHAEIPFYIRNNSSQRKQVNNGIFLDSRIIKNKIHFMIQKVKQNYFGSSLIQWDFDVQFHFSQMQAIFVPFRTIDMFCCIQKKMRSSKIHTKTLSLHFYV